MFKFYNGAHSQSGSSWAFHVTSPSHVHFFLTTTTMQNSSEVNGPPLKSSQPDFFSGRNKSTWKPMRTRTYLCPHAHIHTHNIFSLLIIPICASLVYIRYFSKGYIQRATQNAPKLYSLHFYQTNHYHRRKKTNKQNYICIHAHAFSFFILKTFCFVIQLTLSKKGGEPLSRKNMYLHTSLRHHHHLFFYKKNAGRSTDITRQHTSVYRKKRENFHFY